VGGGLDGKALDKNGLKSQLIFLDYHKYIKFDKTKPKTNFTNDYK
jgi:hypothetical protein